MNWRIQVNYTLVEKDVPLGTPSEYVAYVITDDLSKYEFPSVDSHFHHSGSEYMVASIFIYPTDMQIII